MTITTQLASACSQLDESQLRVVDHHDGPMLIVAGPGSGKTRCLILRAINLLALGRTEPQLMVLCAFSKAAAEELTQRLTIAGAPLAVPEAISRVRITTIHGLSNRIVGQDPQRAGLRPGYAVLNETAQLEFLTQHFDDIFGPDLHALEIWAGSTKTQTVQHTVRAARRNFDRISDEMIDPIGLSAASAPFWAAVINGTGTYCWKLTAATSDTCRSWPNACFGMTGWLKASAATSII